MNTERNYKDCKFFVVVLIGLFVFGIRVVIKDRQLKDRWRREHPTDLRAILEPEPLPTIPPDLQQRLGDPDRNLGVELDQLAL